MATRPVFMVSTENAKHFCIVNTVFEFVGCFSPSKTKQSIESLHNSFLRLNPSKKVLEVSSRSNSNLGLKLSAHNLMLSTKNKNIFALDSIFYASQVFQNGGPYLDLLNKDVSVAKHDKRLVKSGDLVGFKFFHLSFDVEYINAFFNYLYISTLHKIKENRIFADELMQYDAFTDIEYNVGSYSEAEACTLYVALRNKGLIEKALLSKENFIKIVYKDVAKESSSKSLQRSRNSYNLQDEDDNFIARKNNSYFQNTQIIKSKISFNLKDKNNIKKDNVNQNFDLKNLSEALCKSDLLNEKKDDSSYSYYKLESNNLKLGDDEDNNKDKTLIDFNTSNDEDKKEGRVFTAYLNKKEEKEDIPSIVEEVVVKRKRGRPRKVVSTECEVTTPIVVKVKGKRGRPRKKLEETDTLESQNTKESKNETLSINPSFFTLKNTSTKNDMLDTSVDERRKRQERLLCEELFSAFNKN